MDNYLNVAYACDDNYIEQTGISMVSLFENNKEFSNIKIYFVDMGVSESNKIKLTNLANSYGRDICFVPFTDIAWDLNACEGARHILSVYAKFFLCRISKTIKRILYLDSDTIITSSLEALWSNDLEGKTIAATKTICKNAIKRELGLNEDDYFVNDGIVLIDLEKWKSNNYLEKCLAKIMSFEGNPPVLSEGILNAVCYGDIYFMHPRYNASAIVSFFSKKELDILTGAPYYSEKQIQEAKSDPCIVHFAGNTYIRPWFKNSDYPMCRFYYKYKDISVWKDTPLKKSKITKKVKLIRIVHKIVPSRLFLYLYNLKNR